MPKNYRRDIISGFEGFAPCVRFDEWAVVHACARASHAAVPGLRNLAAHLATATSPEVARTFEQLSRQLLSTNLAAPDYVPARDQARARWVWAQRDGAGSGGGGERPAGGCERVGDTPSDVGTSDSDSTGKCTSSRKDETGGVASWPRAPASASRCQCTHCGYHADRPKRLVAHYESVHSLSVEDARARVRPAHTLRAATRLKCWIPGCTYDGRTAHACGSMSRVRMNAVLVSVPGCSHRMLVTSYRGSLLAPTTRHFESEEQLQQWFQNMLVVEQEHYVVRSSRVVQAGRRTLHVCHR